MTNHPVPLASELYAGTCGQHCVGNYECHWCGAPCSDQYFHDDAPRTIGIRHTSGARRPGNPYICTGCWLFRRRRITVNFLRAYTAGHPGPAYRDGQSPVNHSWYVTEDDARALDKLDLQLLYGVLLDPPRHFFLGLLEGASGSVPAMRLHMQTVNNTNGRLADTPLTFTVNNIPFFYAPYELEEALTNPDMEDGLVGKSPGVAALVRMLGPCNLIDKRQPDLKLERGRPPTSPDRPDEGARRLLFSGAVSA